jgi:hypothetical protein
MIKWTEQDYNRIYDLAFSSDYTGYKPNVVELPNGDGKADVAKRYSHLALKYNLHEFPRLEAAFWRGYATALERGLDARLDPEACALRVLEYPVGAGSERHTDFDLFTVNLWRSHPELIHTDPNLWSYCEDVHLGELWPLMEDRSDKAEAHWVEPHPTEVQRSLVFFALPSHEDAVPGTDLLVGEWLQERISRSRSYK